MTDEVQSETRTEFSWGRWIPLGIFLILVIFLAIGLTKDPREVPSVLINKKAPTIILPDLLDMSQMVDSSVMKGQVWMLNVWGTWCPECWKEHDFLVYLATQEKIAFFGINWRDDEVKAREFLVRHGNPFKYIGFDERSKSIMDWGVYGAPETFLIDKQGQIRWKHKGAMTPAVWNTELKAMIQELEQGK